MFETVSKLKRLVVKQPHTNSLVLSPSLPSLKEAEESSLISTTEVLSILLYIYIPWPFPPVWGVADNTKENNKKM